MQNEYVTNIEVTANNRYTARRLPHSPAIFNSSPIFGMQNSALGKCNNVVCFE